MFEHNKYFIFSSNATQSSPKNTADCQTQLNQVRDQFVRVSADFENYKRRMQKEQSQWFDLGQSKVLTQVLGIMDDFDRAMAQSKDAPAQVASWIEGFDLIRKSLHKLLESFDVKEISADVPFDPELHEALVSIENSGKQSGEIVEILQKGYTYKGKVLRPAKVSVAR